MALTTKGWRKITVDGTAYRWKLKHRSPYLSVGIVDAELFGQNLGVYFDEDRVITPKVIEFLIRTSIQSGWQPATPRLQEFVINGDELVKDTEFHLDHPPNCNWTH